MNVTARIASNPALQQPLARLWGDRLMLANGEHACYTTGTPPHGVGHMPLVVMNTRI